MQDEQGRCPMNNKISDLRSSCSKIHFGAVNLSGEEKKFCHEWNREIISLCKSLPESTQTDALLFLMKYSKASFEDLNLFRMYYVPAWSIIYWLVKSCPNSGQIAQQDVKNAKAAHFMAMFLHALDDHLNDKQIPVTHLTLLLRSQAWMLMNNAIRSLAGVFDGDKEMVEDFIDDYYASIRNTNGTNSLTDYCTLFRKQMATWLIVPFILTKKMTLNEKFSNAVQTAYGSFGIAWRLLDDIQDMEIDMSNGIHSAIYVCLNEDIKGLWDKNFSENRHKSSRERDIILQHIIENHIIDTVKERLCRELASAASIFDECNLNGLADEFRCMLKPLVHGQNQ
jgi:hypothetical protein